LLTVAARIKDARKRNNLTQKQVAEMAGLQQSYVYEIETGETNITLRTLARLAEVLETDIRSFLPETVPGPASSGDGSTLRTVLDRAVSVLQELEQADAERHRRQAALLKELQSFADGHQPIAAAAPPVQKVSSAKVPVTGSEDKGVKRKDRPTRSH
jgi:transcriptional regulator with XRE-family HTH domain